MVKIGFDTNAKGGPGIFLTRLKAELEAAGAFSTDNPEVWLQLSHQAVASHRPAKSRLLVRTAGGYYYRHYLVEKPFLLPLPGVDQWVSQQRNKKLNRQIRENLLQADGIVFQSDFARRMTQQFIAKTPAGSIVLNGVDTHVFCPPASRASHQQPIQILVSHQFRPHKRLHEVVRVFGRLRAQFGGARPLILNVLGGDSRGAFAEAQRLIDQLGLGESVKFWGHQPADALPALYQQCDLMIALPLWDPCPNTVVEAVSCGLPVLATDAGGIPEIIGEAGQIIPERLPMTYQDHHHLARIPRIDVEAATQAGLRILERLADYQALARERALHALDIRRTAQHYLNCAEQLLH